MNETAKKILKETLNKYSVLKGCESSIIQAFDVLLSTVQVDGIIYTCGNGGSAADSEHIVGELMKSFRIKRGISREKQIQMKRTGENPRDKMLMSEVFSHLEEGVRAVSLVSQMALSSAIYNDIGVDYVFAQQIYSYAREGDTLIVISTSGKSKNCIYAAVAAKAKGATVIGLTGEAGGELKHYCDVLIQAPAVLTHEVQELHLPIYHCICAMIESELF